MTDHLIRQALRDSVNEVLEKMFFVETPGEASDTTGDPQANEIVVALTFQGAPSGSFLLRLTGAAAHQFAADFLGIDEAEVSGIQTSEVVRELANMICGSVLSRVESAATFRLAAPRIVPPSEEVAGSLSNTRYCAQLFNGRLAVNIGT